MISRLKMKAMIIAIKPMLLKIGIMAMSLAVLQITFLLYESKVFIFYNSILFAIGLHTTLTYSTQISIWFGKLPSVNTYARDSIFALLVVSLVYIINPPFREEYLVLWVFVWFYVFAKYCERIVFNISILNDRLVQAYLLSFLFLTTELTVLIGARVFAEDGVNGRIAYPSLAVFVIFCYILFERLSSNTGTQVKKTPDPGKKSKYVLTLHSFFLLVVIMSERLVAQHYSEGGLEASGYLLMFSYAGAWYSLVVSMVEANRNKLITIANDSSTPVVYMKRLIDRKIFFAGLIFFLLSIVAGMVWFDIVGLIDVMGADGKWIFWLGFLCYFAVFSLSAVLYVFYIARNEGYVLILSWMVALVVKCMSWLDGRMDHVLIYNLVSACLAFIVLLKYKKTERKNVILRQS